MRAGRAWNFTIDPTWGHMGKVTCSQPCSQKCYEHAQLSPQYTKTACAQPVKSRYLCESFTPLNSQHQGRTGLPGETDE